MPKSLADAHIRLAILTVAPVDPKAIKTTELEAGIDASCRILRSDYKLSPTASDNLSEPALCDEGNAQSLGASNYEGSVTPFWYLDEDGQSDPTEDIVYQTLKAKGTELWFVEREGPAYTAPWTAGDAYEVYHVVTDNPQKPSERTGYSKRVVPLAVQTGILDGVVAAGTP